MKSFRSDAWVAVPVTALATWLGVLGVFAALALNACSAQIEVGRDRAAGAGGTGLNTGGASGSGGQPPSVCQRRACQGKFYRCGDCMDNDGDLLSDSEDPECTGPCDDTEDSYYGGIPGQNNAPCRQDCYFDQDSGPGNDQCYWSHECDERSTAPAFPPSGEERCAYQPDASISGSNSTCADLSAVQASTCLDTCLPLTPNGCDCFGCCELPAGSSNFVWIGSAAQNAGTCDAAHVSDPDACHPCTQVRSCLNACDPCEVCVGRTAPLASCTSTSSPRCPASAAACGQPGEPGCGDGFYCITGCCAAAPR
jgi:hypothetical protein